MHHELLVRRMKSETSRQLQLISAHHSLLPLENSQNLLSLFLFSLPLFLDAKISPNAEPRLRVGWGDFYRVMDEFDTWGWDSGVLELTAALDTCGSHARTIVSVLASASWRHLGCRLHLTANLGMVDRCGGEGPAL